MFEEVHGGVSRELRIKEALSLHPCALSNEAYTFTMRIPFNSAAIALAVGIRSIYASSSIHASIAVPLPLPVSKMSW
jgi:hypothetical protein